MTEVLAFLTSGNPIIGAAIFLGLLMAIAAACEAPGLSWLKAYSPLDALAAVMPAHR